MTKDPYCSQLDDASWRQLLDLSRPAHRICCRMWKVCVFIAKFTIFQNVVVVTKITNMSNCFVWKSENIHQSITDWQVQVDKFKKIACAAYISSNIQHKTLGFCVKTHHIHDLQPFSSASESPFATFRVGIKLCMIPEAGHHIYADQATFFNDAVNKALTDPSD